MRALPSAEQEAQTIVAAYNGVPLVASLSSLKRLLDADLEHQFERIGGATPCTSPVTASSIRPSRIRPSCS